VLHLLLLGGLPEVGVLLGAEALDLGRAAVSGPALDLLRGLLRPDPERRTTAAAAAAHRWLRPEASAAPRDLAPTVAALTAFHRSKRLRRAALTALAMQLTSQQLEGLREEFMLMDSDGNGRISREEFTRSVSLAAPDWADEVQCWVESVFDAVDADGSQEIEYTEWMAAALNEEACRCDQAIRAAFRVFDIDGSGGIDHGELARVLRQTPDEIAELLPQFDTNGDGVIDFEEFRRLLAGSQGH